MDATYPFLIISLQIMFMIFGNAKVLFSVFQETFNSIAVSRNLASTLELFPSYFPGQR